MTEPKLRPARREECAALSALALRSKASWGYTADFLARCASELTLSPEDVSHAFVLETAEGVQGFYALSPLDAPRVELEFLFVLFCFAIQAWASFKLDRNSTGQGFATSHETAVMA